MMKRTNFLLAIFCIAVLLPTTLFAQKKESLAVFAFTGGNASDGEAIASSLTRQASLRNSFNKTTLITRTTIATMNFEQRFQRNSGLTDADTIFELGKQLNASHVIAGYITKLGSSNLVLVSIMDVESLQQIAGDYRAYRSIEEIDSFIPDMAKKLAAAVPRDTSRLAGLSVPPFSIASGVNQNDAMVLAQILSCDLANAGKYAVLPRTDSIEKVREEHQRQRSGTTDQDRIKRLGVGRNAQYILSGSVQKLGTLNKFTADVLDIVDGSFIDGHEESYTEFAQGFELMPKLAARISGGTTPTTINIVTTAPRTITTNNVTATITPVNTSSLSDIQWKTEVWGDNASAKNNSSARFNINRERIDGQEREVLTLETNVVKGCGGQLVMEYGPITEQMRRSSGIRLKALGDGKKWRIQIPTQETMKDFCFYETTVSTQNGKVITIDVPYSKLKQPSWGKKANFSKGNIVGFNIQKHFEDGTGASTIKVFDFEIY